MLEWINMYEKKLEGIFIPHITPFTKSGELDLEALKTCVRFWLDNGVSGLVTCGSNGEAPYLSREERKKVISTVVDEVNGKAMVVAGTGSISTRETIKFTKDAEDIGADAALVVTPFYFRLSDKELIQHYKALMEAVNIPIVLYNVPKFTSVHLKPEITAQLVREHSNIIGVKDSGSDIAAIKETIRLVGDKISVLAGTADLTLPTLKIGGKGAVIAVANVFPRICLDLYKAFKHGELEKAEKLQKQITRINEVLVKKHGQLSAIKEAINILGLPAGYPRRPSLPLEESERKEIKNFIEGMQALFGGPDRI